MKNLKGTGLKHNPCQGCEGYYTRDGLFGQCVMDFNDDCAWIKEYDEAPNQPDTQGEAEAETIKKEIAGNGHQIHN